MKEFINLGSVINPKKVSFKINGRIMLANGCFCGNSLTNTKITFLIHLYYLCSYDKTHFNVCKRNILAKSVGLSIHELFPDMAIKINQNPMNMLTWSCHANDTDISSYKAIERWLLRKAQTGKANYRRAWRKLTSQS